MIGASATLGLIDYIHNHGGMVATDALVKNVAVLFRASRAKIRNTITLLNDLGIVEMHGDQVSSSEVIEQPDVLGARLVDYVVTEHLPPRFGDALLLADGTNEIWVDAKRAPGRHLGIGSLLVDLGVFHRDRLTSTTWRIGDQYAGRFVQAIAQSNDDLSLGTLSADDLQRRLAGSVEAGLRAEEWVVGFERSRLKDHLLRRQIRRISDHCADAGFDVLSFRDQSSIVHNWFIEVKSFVETPRFYWTANEIECAKREGERYVLYLVDRSQMRCQGYEPRVIRGPYEFFFESEMPTGWDVVATEYQISAGA